MPEIWPIEISLALHYCLLFKVKVTDTILACLYFPHRGLPHTKSQLPSTLNILFTFAADRKQQEQRRGREESRSLDARSHQPCKGSFCDHQVTPLSSAFEDAVPMSTHHRTVVEIRETVRQQTEDLLKYNDWHELPTGTR